METQPQTAALANRPDGAGEALERVLINGNLKQLTPEQRVTYYHQLCGSLGLNPLTRPFEYLELQGKLTLYARKDCTEQLRNHRKISVTILSREVTEGVYVVTAKAADASGRCDESIGAVPIENTKGEARANAMMKAETKAKRRVTLSFCGLGMLDETEVETIPGATKVVDAEVVPTEQKTQAPETTGQKKPAQNKPAEDNSQKAAMDKLVALLGTKGIAGGKAVLAWFTDQTKRKITKLSEVTRDEYAEAMQAAEKLPAKAEQKGAA